jgi:hypothetical protein
MAWAENIECMYTGVLNIGQKERDHLEDLRGDSGVILRWILKKWDGKVQDWFKILPRIGTSGKFL